MTTDGERRTLVLIEPPQILQTAARLTAVVHLTVPRSELHEVMGPGVVELMSTVAAQGVATTGPWFTHHLRMPLDGFDFEIGVPVASAVAPAGRVRMSELPAATVARAMYQGPYERLGAAWGELDALIRSQGREPGPALWEHYTVGPESKTEPALWRTELNRPLIDA